MMAKIKPQPIGGLDRQWFETMCIWLFFYVIPEDCYYQSLKVFGILSHYINTGEISKGKERKEFKEKTNYLFIKELVRDYAEEIDFRLEELPDKGDIVRILQELLGLYNNAVLIPAIAGDSEYIHLTSASNLLGYGFRTLFMFVWDNGIPLYKNQFNYLYLKREDLPRIVIE